MQHNNADITKNILLSDVIRDEAVMMVKTEFGKTAADIGAGTGFMTEGLLNAGLNVIVVEPSPEGADFLRKRFGHFREVDILSSGLDKIRIPDDSVDYAFSYMQMHSVEEPLSLISGMRRILKPGGKLAIIDLAEYKNEDLLKTLGHRWPGFSMPDLYEWFVKGELKEISIEVLDQSFTLESADGTSVKAEVFLAYGEKH